MIITVESESKFFVRFGGLLEFYSCRLSKDSGVFASRSVL